MIASMLAHSISAPQIVSHNPAMPLQTALRDAAGNPITKIRIPFLGVIGIAIAVTVSAIAINEMKNTLLNDTKRR